MNEEIREFLDELKWRPDVLGVILFGSWARGNHRPDSDVDLLVILGSGHRPAVEYRGKQVFEIIYTTEAGALEYWENHGDDAAGFWEVAKILHDKDGTIRRLHEKTQDTLRVGKKPIGEPQLEQLRFVAEYQLEYVENILADDWATANLVLENRVLILTGLFFDVRQLWTPAPKQRLSKIREVSPEFHALLQGFYRENVSIQNKLDVAKKMIPVVFQQQ